jgi:hypothetical protein
MNPTAENLKGRCMDRQLARAKSSLNGLIHAFINESKKQQQKQEIAAPISTKKKPIDAWLISALGLFYRLLWLQLFS